MLSVPSLYRVFLMSNFAAADMAVALSLIAAVGRQRKSSIYGTERLLVGRKSALMNQPSRIQADQSQFGGHLI